MNYDGKHALVLGLGESGLAMALWLARAGARVRVADTRDAPQRLAALRAAVADAEFVAGDFSVALLDGVD
ncbi:MAG TPA: UDP-N-acetylmuramoyl-L-alanine--D-glutamate ligase, partial [Massilia timonae]|nr:UDP-N-acetylmuramoyl-L-alanine--D-glutamate ligase [Massilia timonae]